MTSRGLLMVKLVKDAEEKQSVCDHFRKGSIEDMNSVTEINDDVSCPTDAPVNDRMNMTLEWVKSNYLSGSVVANECELKNELEDTNKKYIYCKSESCTCTHVSDTTTVESQVVQDPYIFSEFSSVKSSTINKTFDECFFEAKDCNNSPISDDIPTQGVFNIPLYKYFGDKSNSTSSDTEYDDKEDKDFNILVYSEQSSSSTEISDDEVNERESVNLTKSVTLNKISNYQYDNVSVNTNKARPISELIMAKRKSTKKATRCKYCIKDVISKNFARHMETFHREEDEIKQILKFPKGSKERREAFILLRKSSNFDLYINGETRPYRGNAGNDSALFYPCVYCKGLFKKQYLKRHTKACKNFRNNTDSKLRKNYIADSQTIAACAIDPTNTISRLNVKEQVFNIMKGDEVSFTAKKDLLIVYFGESYLKKHKRERKEYACSSRMRELSRLLIAYREIINDKTVQFKDILNPKNFDNVLIATRKITGYDPQKKIFAVPSLAMHLGTYLKVVCDELIHLILKESHGFKCRSKEESQLWQLDVTNFQKLVVSHWTTEISSLANKDLQEKRWNKPLLLPLVSDIKIFREETLRIANECQQKFFNNTDSIDTYKSLVQATLALLILFNRRRIGDLQYLKVVNYQNDQKSNFTDFEHILTDTEKILTANYKRVVNSGKGSRQVVILIPLVLQNFMTTILKNRNKYIPKDNEYIFAIPKSKIKWGQGDVAIRNLTKTMTLKYPEAISSNKLRKHIATVTQILNLSQQEIKQFCKFMGHTEKTHEEFYELPVDIYQTAKVSKLLLMMEKGSLPIDCKGKSLAEIHFDEKNDYPEENNEGHDDTEKEHKSEVTLTDVSPIVINNENDIKDSKWDTREIPSKKRPKINKKSWTNTEISQIEEYFSKCIAEKTYPSSIKIQEFKQKTEIDRTIPVIRSKIQHLIKK